ncbi:MAG: TIGR04211 family SH3 domain-containing protein [Desulfobacteraceae bacterium]|nr:TIGR04211 family SH3 domain-containing protein [Desulfobacteraceae bacterium]
MKMIMRTIAILFLWGLIYTPVLSAQYIYVSGITKITVRTGPGTDHKIIAMVESGTQLEVVSSQPDWTLVKTSEGKEGWVLTRFLTKSVPKVLLVNKLERKNQELTSTLAVLEEKNQELTVQNASLAQIEEKYDQLRSEASDYLQLQDKYQKVMKQFEAQAKQMEELESSLDNEEKLWVLCGAGVFIVGLILGLSTRRKRRSSLL